MTENERWIDDERRARLGRPPRPYDPTHVDTVLQAYNVVRSAEGRFLGAIEQAIAGGVPLRDLESLTGISRTTLSRGPKPHWHTY
jgi:hypothetical protein